MKTQPELYRELPSVDDLLHSSAIAELAMQEGQTAVADACRAVLSRLRGEIGEGYLDSDKLKLALSDISNAVRQELTRVLGYSLRPVINATGVILHTNLGRAPITQSAFEHVRETAGAYSNLEFDIEAGERGKRDVHVDRLFRKLLSEDSAELRSAGQPGAAVPTPTDRTGKGAHSTPSASSVAQGRLRASTATAEPDVLVMTATPIPRTLALTLYGDLDLSVLDEMPPGRTAIVTKRVGDESAEKVWQFVRQQVATGHQAYVVYPVIEENEESELKAAMKMYRELSKKVFPDLQVAVLHGRMESDLKEQVMRLFQQGKIQILVSTTVIEVGVDVPNAAVMVIEHAERFGLAQLHQLRGRIGRGAAKSYCILMTGGKVSEEAERRLDAMVRTNDGFEIAELDLEMRGPGEFFGTRQAGMPSFQVASLIRDRDLLELAKKEASSVLAGPNSEISQAEIDRALRQMRTKWQKTYGLVEVG
jgi:hypothetical protein